MNEPAAASPADPPPPVPPPVPPSADDSRPAASSGRPDARHTWLNQELELLISAAIAFSLFQLPGRIDALFLRLEPHMGDDLRMWLIIAYELALMVVYGLIVTFGGHFLLRSFWVALLGLRSVIPEGVEWSKLKLGPISETFYRGYLPTLRELEERMDRAASMLFSFLFLFLLVVVQSVVAMAALGSVATAVAWVLPVADPAAVRRWIFVGLAAVVVVVSMVVLAVDKLLASERWRGRVPRWPRRFAERVLPWMARLGTARVYLPIFFTLSGRTSRGRLQATLIAFTYLLMGAFLVGVLLREGVLRVDGYFYYPAKIDAGELEARHYDDLRAEGDVTYVPTIPSDVITGDYLRLFVPYDPRDDNERIALLCPGVERFRSAAAYVVRKRQRPPSEKELAAVHACFDRLATIELDGRPLGDVDWLFHIHPESGARGRIAYLPTAALAPGKHLLVIRDTPSPDREPDDPPPTEHYIPFWR